MLYLRIWDQRGRSPVWYEGSRAPPLNFHLHSVRTWIQQLLLEAPIQELGLSLCDAFSSSSSFCSCWAVLCWLSFQCPLHHWDVQHLSGQEQRPLLEGWILPLRYWVTPFFFLLLFLFLCNSWSSSASKKNPKMAHWWEGLWTFSQH